MLALELSGIHVGKQISITFRFKSWPKSKPDAKEILKIHSVEHKNNGHVTIKTARYSAIFTYPFDAEVEFLE